MSGFPIVDLVAGIIFVFFLLSIICSSVVEMVLTAGKFRAKMLEKWMLNIFDNKIDDGHGNKIPLGQAIMDHCTTAGLSEPAKSPSYIDAKNFTAALLEKITYDPANPKSVATDIDQMIKSIENSDMLTVDLQRAFLGYANETKDSYKALSVKVSGEIEMFKSKIEKWFDTSMDRVSGSLKATYTRKFTFWIALVIVFSLNADIINIAKYLYKNPEARTHLAQQAYEAGKNDSIKNQVARVIARHAKDSSTVDSATAQQLTDSLTMHIQEIKQTRSLMMDDALPLGWDERSIDFNGSNWYILLQLISKIAGLMATVFAIMMGAPFWFDVLNKISNMRGSGTKPVTGENKK